MTDLLATTTELMAVSSVSGNEAAIAALVEDRLAAMSWLTVERVGDNVVARTTLSRPQRLVVAGHPIRCRPATTSGLGRTATPCGESAHRT